MKDCCPQDDDLRKLRTRQRGVLQVVLAINATMFVVEMTAGLFARSTSLLADSLDMLGDAFVYGLSLAVLDRSEKWKAGSALVKAGVMAALGLFVLGEAAFKYARPILPSGETIGIVGAAALAANLVCLYLLTRHRDDDVNMRSVWLCSRNDIIGNVGVILAGGLVLLTQSRLPDLALGVILAAIVLRSSGEVLKDSLGILLKGKER